MFDLRSRKAAAMVVVVDFLLAVLLMQQAILSLTTINQNKTPPRIETLGIYVIKVTWDQAHTDDVDLYVRDPLGNTAFFSNTQAGLMHLERDDLGNTNDVGITVINQERVVIRGTEEGEYIVNVHMYRKDGNRSVKVHVELWRLKGADKPILVKDVVLTRRGDEVTVFRFTLDKNQKIINTNTLQRHLVSTAVAQDVSGRFDSYPGPPG